jgi:hypothetical protein
MPRTAALGWSFYAFHGHEGHGPSSTFARSLCQYECHASKAPPRYAPAMGNLHLIENRLEMNQKGHIADPAV